MELFFLLKKIGILVLLIEILVLSKRNNGCMLCGIYNGFLLDIDDLIGNVMLIQDIANQGFLIIPGMIEKQCSFHVSHPPFLCLTPILKKFTLRCSLRHADPWFAGLWLLDGVGKPAEP